MTDKKTPQQPGTPVAELQKTIELTLEHDRKGYDVQGLLFHAQKLVNSLQDSPAVSAIAGYQMKANPKVFYPADFRPTDINNFATVVYANGDEYEPTRPHYVIRYLGEDNQPGNAYGMVSIANWNVGMSRAIAQLVCDEQGMPLVVYPRPVQGVTAAEPVN